MAEQKENAIRDDEKKEDKSPFSLMVSVQNNTLEMDLRDNNTKNQYHAAFTPEELQKECGFSNKQITNLDRIRTFIETAKAGQKNLKFSISIEQNNTKDVVNDNDNDNDIDNDVEGVYGVDVLATSGSGPSEQAENKEVGVVKITKEDDFFGEMQFIMKLTKKPREQSDVNQDHIKDLKDENLALKQQLNSIRQDYQKQVNQLKEHYTTELKTSDIALRQRLDSLQQQLSESNEQYTNKLKNADVEKQREMHEMKKHEMPKGSIVMWSGSIDHVPKGWRICDGKGGTPDLRNKFIIGAGAQYNVKTTGGNKQHSHQINVDGHQLTVNEMPRHRHKSQYPPAVQDDNNTRTVGCNTDYHKKMHIGYMSDYMNLDYSGGNAAHNHTASSSSTEHLPPYFALCFIIKTI